MSEYLYIVKCSIDSHDMFASMRACVRVCVSACTTLNMILIKIDRMLRQSRSWLTVVELFILNKCIFMFKIADVLDI